MKYKIERQTVGVPVAEGGKVKTAHNVRYIVRESDGHIALYHDSSFRPHPAIFEGLKQAQDFARGVFGHLTNETVEVVEY